MERCWFQQYHPMLGKSFVEKKCLNLKWELPTEKKQHFPRNKWPIAGGMTATWGLGPASFPQHCQVTWLCTRSLKIRLTHIQENIKHTWKLNAATGKGIKSSSLFPHTIVASSGKTDPLWRSTCSTILECFIDYTLRIETNLSFKLAKLFTTIQALLQLPFSLNYLCIKPHKLRQGNVSYWVNWAWKMYWLSFDYYSYWANTAEIL